MHNPLDDALDSLADRRNVDWDALEKSADGPSRDAIRSLRQLASLAQVSTGASSPQIQTAPFRWGPLDVRERIAQGAHGTVFRAWDPQLERDVALKLLHATADDPADVALREGRLLARIRHPNVVTVYGADRIDSQAGIWMECVEGRTLRQEVGQRGPLTDREAAAIGIDVCRALTAIHNAGLIHRDVNAQNVYRTPDKRTLLMDLGAGGDNGHAALEGSPIYLAPEVLDGASATNASDVYALGVLLYYLVTGTYPLTADTLDDLRQKHAADASRPLRPGVRRSQRFCGVVNRALAKDPRQRFASAEEMRHALERAGLRRGTLLAAAAVGVAALATLAFLSPWQSADGLTLGRQIRVTSEAGLEIDPALSPDGRRIAYAAGVPGRMKVMIKPLPDGAAQPLIEEFEADQRRPRWSPDGTSVLFTSGGTIVIVPIGGEPPTQIRTAALIRSAEWFRDGSTIFFVSDDTLYRVAPAGGPVTPVRTLDRTAYALAISPDGTRVAYASNNPDWIIGTTQFANQAPGTILVASLAGGEPVAITDHARLNTSPRWMQDGRRLLFVSDRGGTRDIYLTTIDEQGHALEPAQMTTGLGAHTIDVSADGLHLAYSVLVRRANAAALPIVEDRILDSADVIPLTSGNQTVEQVGASPDGEWLLFDSDVRGNADVFRMRMPGGQPEALTTSEMDEFFNDVSPDGQEVAYHALVNGRRQVYVMPTAGGTRVLVGPGLGSQWSPDGRRLVMAVQHASEGAPVHAVVGREEDGSWGPPRPIRSEGCSDIWRWREDGRAFITVCNDAITMLDLDGHEISQVYAPHSEGDPVPASVGKILRANMWFKAYDANGASFWTVPLSGGRPRLRARLTDPTRPSSRVEFNNDARFVYLTIDDRQADLWFTDMRQARRW